MQLILYSIDKDNPLQFINSNSLDMQIGHISKCHISTQSTQLRPNR
jgi:hypothetical protein